ncbi:MAG: hypothetical protein IT329_06495 [Caldilineaceae bacterium]|nr:hypothetical protein [Caldilineaceae bacterium]
MAETKLQVRGEIDMEKFRAAKTLGGNDTKFELRAMKPVRGGNLASSCIICLICIICVVCSARVAEENKLVGLRPLPT